MVLRKKDVYTHITPIPSHIPRQLAIDLLHNHAEIINLNPLVLEHRPIPASRDAPADEYYCTWYEIIERIQYVPGMGKMGSGKISFKGCFHDMPWGLQTHIYAPMNVDIKNKWQIAGNQPGEPPEKHELGIGAPPEGLFLREDIEIKCNMALISFVKAQMKAASKILVARLIKKAELLDAGVLLAMMENGKLKTVNPADRTHVADPMGYEPVAPMSPAMPYHNMAAAQNYQYGRPPSQGHSPSFYPQQNMSPVPQYVNISSNQQYANTPYKPPPNKYQHTSIELPGDNKYYQDPRISQDTSHLHPSYSPHPTHASFHSDYTGSSPEVSQGRWSDYYQSQMGGSRPISYDSNANPMRSPGPESKFQRPPTSELPTMKEERDLPPPLPSKDPRRHIEG